jgi:hypothetical protein
MQRAKLIKGQAGDLADAMAAACQLFQEPETLNHRVRIEAAVGIRALATDQAISFSPDPDDMRGQAGAVADDLDGMAQFGGGWGHGLCGNGSDTPLKNGRAEGSFP